MIRKKNFFRYYLRCFAITLYFWLACNIVWGDDAYWVRMVNYFMPWIVLITFLHGGASYLLQAYQQALLILIAASLIAFPYIHLFFPYNTQNRLDAQKVSIISYSVMGRNKDIDSIARVIRTHPADIIFLQEVSQPDLLYAKLSGLYGAVNPVYFIKSSLPIVSRFPLQEGKCNNDIACASVQVRDKKIHLCNIHATKSIFGKTSYLLQQKTIQKLLGQERLLNESAIIAGDFNATESSQIYRSVSQYFNNAHWESGFGFGFTFPAPARRIGTIMPFVRIDHIFYNRYFRAVNSEVIKESGGSDHFPIFATLALN